MLYASVFRGNKLSITQSKLLAVASVPRCTAKSKADYYYAIKLCTLLRSLTDSFALRVESPWLSIYTNSKSDVEHISGIDPNMVKVLHLPNTDIPVLEKNTVIVKSLDFGFRVHMAKTNQRYTEFLTWSENNPKIRLTRLAKSKLGCSKSSGGYYFYVKDDRSLTIVKMFLGSDIRKVEIIIKA